jgi:DNA-binding NarL/FixJ family response regulator
MQPRDRLTQKELTVAGLVWEGLTNREIAERLHISEKTVANHLTHIFTKIGVENRAAAVAVSLRRQLGAVGPNGASNLPA